MIQETISVTIEEQKIEVTVLTPTFIQVNLLTPVVLDAVTDNTNHRLGDGSDHSDVSFNSAFIDAGGYNASPDKAIPVGADLISIEDSTSLFSKAKLSLTNLLTFIFNRVATFLNYTTPKLNLTPANGATATMDYNAAGDYTITPSGASFTLAIDNIPADQTAWSIRFYAINWDGVTVTMPLLSVTPDNAGLSFTSGGGKDRVVACGNSGPAGEKEFYNLQGNMG